MAEHHDPNGRVECGNCETTAKPEGGVHYIRVGNSLTTQHQLPKGWAFRACTLLCTKCARAEIIPAKERKSVVSLADVLLQHSSPRCALANDGSMPKSVDQIARDAQTERARAKRRANKLAAARHVSQEEYDQDPAVKFIREGRERRENRLVGDGEGKAGDQGD